MKGLEHGRPGKRFGRWGQMEQTELAREVEGALRPCHFILPKREKHKSYDGGTAQS